MIHAGALGGVPEFIAEVGGWRAVDRAFSAVGLTAQIVDFPERRIPMQLVSSVIESGAREIGDAEIGLLLWHHISVKTYGTWGRYLTSAPTLREALNRLTRTISYHSPEDALWLTYRPEAVVVHYRFAVFGKHGSDNTSYCAAGALLSVIQYFLGAGWRPKRLNLSIPKRAQDSQISQSFGCDVKLGVDHISFDVPSTALDTCRPPNCEPVFTLADVERARSCAPKTALRDTVADVIWAQLLDQAPSLENVARMMQIGPRTLQRRLAVEGVSFREIERGVVMTRARELLTEADRSITEVAAELCYASTGHFTRAFTRVTGQTPSGFRKESQAIATVSTV